MSEKTKSQLNGEQYAHPMLDPNGSYTQYGLTKREYIATQIAIGLSVKAIAGPHNRVENMMLEVSEYAVSITDALLDKLEETKI